MSEDLLRVCPKCGTRVRVRAGEETGRCEACNAVVSRASGGDGPSARLSSPGDQSLTPTVVLIGSLLLLLAGAVALRTFRRPAGKPPSAAREEPVYVAPPVAAPKEAEAGEIAWEPEAHAPVIVDADADGVEDLFGFFRVWDGRSAWMFYAGMFDGAKLSPLWRSEPIDPQILKRQGVLPSALVVGSRVVVSDTTPTLRVFEIAKGAKQMSLLMGDGVVALCKAPDPAPRIWVQVAGDQHAIVDLDTGKAKFAARPAWCALPDPPPPPPKVAPGAKRKAVDAGAPNPACKDDFRNGLARAACMPGADGPSLAGVTSHYLLRGGPLAVVLGTQDDRPVAFGVGPGFKASWSTPLVADDTKPTPEAPHIAELADGKLYVVFSKLYFDARLVSLDAATGARLWDVPLVGSLPSSTADDVGRGEARGLVASKARVYVTRSGGGLDVFDAADGRAIGTIGRL